MHVETCVTLWYLFKTKTKYFFLFFYPFLGISVLLSNQTIKVIGLIFFLWAGLEKSFLPPPFIWLDGNLDFLISISLQLNVVHLRYFNLWILLDQIIYKVEISKVYTIRLQRNSDLKIFVYGQEDSIIANILKD